MKSILFYKKYKILFREKTVTSRHRKLVRLRYGLS